MICARAACSRRNSEKPSVAICRDYFIEVTLFRALHDSPLHEFALNKAIFHAVKPVTMIKM